MVEHKQMAILDPISNQLVEVDEGIAPLVKAMWIALSISIRFPVENYQRLLDLAGG
jgi:hypothetical protein